MKNSKNSSLNETSAIVKTTSKIVEVQATPGSGKTHALIHRAAHLIESGVSAQQILALSFSNESVRELRRRLESLSTALTSLNSPIKQPSDKELSNVTIKTVHSLAASLLGNKVQGLLKPKDAKALFKQSIKELRKHARKQRAAFKTKLWNNRCELLDDLLDQKEVSQSLQAQLLSLIAKAQASAVSPQSLLDAPATAPQHADLAPFAKVLNKIGSQYAKQKRTTKTLDFGDLLAQAHDTIEKSPRGFPYTNILVDEYQDSSAQQVHFLAALVKKHGCHLMVFGDKNQALYSFGGNHYTPLATVLDSVETMSLPVSRRLTAPVAALASAVIGLKGSAAIKITKTGARPTLTVNTSLTTQTARIAQDIEALIQKGAAPSSIAVLARTRAFIDPVEQRLLAQDIPTSRAGTTRHIDHPLRVLRFVSLIERVKDREDKASKTDKRVKLEAEMQHILRKEKCAVTDTAVWKKQAQLLMRVRTPSLEARYSLCAKIYLALLGGSRKNSVILHDVNRWTAMCRGADHARAMREKVREIARAESLETSTIHAAKGKEWDHVFVVGLADGQLPLYLSRSPAALDEERRLLYVAITRAKKTVSLYYAPVDHARSRKRFDKMSQFITKAVRPTLVRVVDNTLI
jgi:DNA helicase II / ATP-dependent DNA helicase PcrA